MEITFKAALFDLDGVVLDTEGQYSQFWGQMGREYRPDVPDFAQRIKGQTLVQIFDAWITDPDKRAEINRRLDEFEAGMQYNYIEGTRAYVEELRRRGILTAIVTSSNRPKMEAVYRARPELKTLFDRILTAEDPIEYEMPGINQVLVRQDIGLTYFGLKDAVVLGQRPQLTRVIVNLLTNAIQAFDGQEGEKRIVIAVRNSDEDGFYDIVVEDNGPGVDEADQKHIFTPDFTTKTSGSGLGLAICKRFVDHAGGTISYSRSFTLGGACFTVHYPKA